jgi:hypothetical protein
VTAYGNSRHGMSELCMWPSTTAGLATKQTLAWPAAPGRGCDALFRSHSCCPNGAGAVVLVLTAVGSPWLPWLAAAGLGHATAETAAAAAFPLPLLQQPRTGAQDLLHVSGTGVVVATQHSLQEGDSRGEPASTQQPSGPHRPLQGQPTSSTAEITRILSCVQL